MTFNPDVFKKMLRKSGKTLDDVATSLNKHTRTISRWLAGENPPKEKDLENLAKLLNCRIEDFYSLYSSADENDVPLHNHISIASQNAYDIMRWRYGVSRKDIVELAPVLFSMVAGYALNIPNKEQDFLELTREKFMNNSEVCMNPNHYDTSAQAQRKCFGIVDEQWSTRNLFVTAIKYLSLDAKEYVSDSHFMGAEPEHVPTASGYIVDKDIVHNIAQGKKFLIDAVAKGRINLSQSILNVRKRYGNDFTLKEGTDFIESLYLNNIEAKRRESLEKLRKWQEFYTEHYPDLARGYDEIVHEKCFRDNWHPIHFYEKSQFPYGTYEQRFQSWIDPFLEKDIYLDEDKIAEEANINILEWLGASSTHPTVIRFNTLTQHRIETKKEFTRTYK